MRVALAQGTTLAISWAGRPHWMYHHMGLGETIGYSTRLTQNNSNLYSGNYGMRYVHVALLGDPTLRMWYAPPPSELSASVVDDMHVKLNWKESDGTVMGYKVYRRSSPDETFEPVTGEIIPGTEYTDSCVIDPGHYMYMVRSIHLATTPSGSYYDLSTGISDTISQKTDHAVLAEFEFTVSGDTLRVISNTSLNATSYFWEFGDGNISTDVLPEHVYAAPGHYEVSLTAVSGCDEHIVIKSLDILSAVSDHLTGPMLEIYPNPTKDEVVITLASGGPYQVLLYHVDGGTALSDRRIPEGPLDLNLDGMPAGMYIVHVIDHKGFRSVGKILLH
jgi:hypothetical protein